MIPIDRLRVLTLNIWNRQGPFPARRELILQGLRRESPDLIALQEVLRLEQGGTRLCQAEELGVNVFTGFPVLRRTRAVIIRTPATGSASITARIAVSISRSTPAIRGGGSGGGR